MAIRKMRKKMKPVILIITIGFFISMLTVIVSNISMGLKNKQYAFKVNGEKISRQSLERGINQTISQYGQYLNDSLDREKALALAGDELINRELLKEVGEELNIEVSSSEVNKKYNAIKGQFPEKKQFERALKYQGFTKKTFKRYLEESMFIEKTQEVIAQKSKEEGKNQLLKVIGKKKKNVKVEDIREEYKNLLPKEEFVESNFKVTNVDVLKTTLYVAYAGEKDFETAKEKAIENLKEEIKVATIAEKRGAVRDTTLDDMTQINDLRNQLLEIERNKIKPTEKELKNYFKANKEARYDIKGSVDAKIIKFKEQPSSEDEKLAKEKAEKLLKEVTSKNFKEMAKKFSEGPSSVNGGELGFFKKEQMVPEFANAAFKGKVGEIYPELVKTQFGYHIILVEEKKENEVRAAHILIKVGLSEKTKKNTLEDAKLVLKKIKEGKLTFEEAAKKDYSVVKSVEYKNITKVGYIRPLGVELELTKKLFDNDLNTVDLIVGDTGIFIFQKTNEIKAEETTFEKSKEAVKKDYINEKLIEKMREII